MLGYKPNKIFQNKRQDLSNKKAPMEIGATSFIF